MAETSTDHPQGGRRPARMSDVARLAGVSNQTVSRVLNTPGQVREETRERVAEAMRLLEYRPNRLAQALVTGRSRTLGVVSFDTTLHGPASTLLGFERAAHAEGYFVSVVSLTRLDRAALLDAIQRLRDQGVEGLGVIAPQIEAVQALLGLPSDVPIVALEAGPAHGVPVAAVDQEAGARMAVEHLLELGHRTVHHVAGPQDFLEALHRLDAWRQTLLDAGRRVPPALVGDWSARSGAAQGRRLAGLEEVTAVFVANDQMALGVIHALQAAGRRLPGDISIVGFDDIPEAAYFTPALTTIRQDFNEMGRRGLHVLLAAIDSDARQAADEVVAPELVVRASTGPPGA